jgi:protein TonB
MTTFALKQGNDKRLAAALALSLVIHLGSGVVAGGIWLASKKAPALVEVDLSFLPSAAAGNADSPARAEKAPVPEPKPVSPRHSRPAPVASVVPSEPEPADPGPAGPEDQSPSVESAPENPGSESSAMTGGLPGRGAGHEDARRAYARRVNRQIERARKVYPIQSRLQETREEGTVKVRFVILLSGAVSEVAVTKSSGYPLLDQAAVEIVKNAAPFPPLPPELGLDELSLTKPIEFSIRPAF